MQDHRSQPPYQQRSNFSDWCAFVCDSIGASCNVFLHKRPGARYLDVQGVFGMLAILFFTLLFSGDNSVGLFVFLGCFLLAAFCTRVGVLRRKWKGVIVHSRYNGYPRLMRLFPRADERTIKRFVEPPLVFIVGALMLGVDQGVGAYLMIASFALFHSTNAAEAINRRRLDDLNDSIIEQRQMGEQLRRMHK